MPKGFPRVQQGWENKTLRSTSGDMWDPSALSAKAQHLYILHSLQHSAGGRSPWKQPSARLGLGVPQPCLTLILGDISRGYTVLWPWACGYQSLKLCSVISAGFLTQRVGHQRLCFIAQPRCSVFTTSLLYNLWLSPSRHCGRETLGFLNYSCCLLSGFKYSLVSN